MKHFPNDALGCNSVSWGPYNAIGSLSEDPSSPSPIRRLVTGSCDNTVRVWRCAGGSEGQWTEEGRHGKPHTGKSYRYMFVLYDERGE